VRGGSSLSRRAGYRGLSAGAAVYAAAFAAVTVAWGIDPRLDLAVSRLFYRPGDGFFLSGEPWARFVSSAVPWAAWTIGLGILAAGLWAWLRPGGSRRLRRVTAYLLLALLLGPGLLTNVLLKDHWGRARPYQVAAFGGGRAFTPPLVPAHQCTTNCSFVAGHPSVAFFLVAFAFLVRDPPRRRLAIAAAVAAGLAVGFVRVVQGQHFASDVLYSGLLNVGLIWVLWRRLAATGGAGTGPGRADPA